MNELMLFEKGDQVVVSSRIVAEKFEKQHKSVLQAIQGESRTGDVIPGY